MFHRRSSPKILAFVLAGGEGKRLIPLTKTRCKPAVPFGGRYRLIDFVLSNLINSEIYSIYLLVQNKPHSLIEHIRKAWTTASLSASQFVTVVPPQIIDGGSGYAGTADAVFQNLHLLDLQRPDIVAILGADQIYRMDVRQMVWFHQERKAAVSVAAIPVPVARASEFGIIEANENGEVLGFQEKPHKPRAMSSDPNRAYASMGIYLFDRNVLSRSLEETVRSGGTDFGHHLIPRLIGKHRVYAYDFSTNTVPGIKPYEETGYWRDLGTIDSYFAAHQDVLGEEPRFDAFNPQWPIYSSNYQGPVARIMGGTIDNSLFGSATVVHRATIRNSIIRREAVIEPGVLLEDCVIMDYVRVSSGSSLRRVIVDRHNVIQANTRIGYDRERDRNEYYVSPTGLVVVPHGNVTYYARDSRGAGPGYIE